MISMDGVPRPQATPKTPDADMDTGEDIYAGSAAAANCAGGEVSRHSRLARKAESARQARLRHKQFVQELQEQVSTLTSRIAQLESQPSAFAAVHELRGALSQEQLSTLLGWLQASQGTQNVLSRFGQPPPSAPDIKLPRSNPVPIGSGDHAREGSDEDSTFVMGDMPRSWDDIEGARSILNLNSPNGFHPRHRGLNSSFMLPSAAASAPERAFYGSVPVNSGSEPMS